MPLNPQTEAFFASMAEGGDRPQTHEQQPAEARQGYLALAQALGPGPELHQVEDRKIPGEHDDIPLRVYTPKASDNALPALIYFHGGGWVIGDLDTHDRECRLLADQADCVVIAVDYRLAPEHPFPASHQDCWSALHYVVEHPGHFNIDAGRIAVGGDSAGGNLSAFVALAARDAQIDLKLQMLIYPATDARAHHPDSEHEPYPSLLENADAVVLTRDTMRYFASHVATGQNHKDVVNDWRMSPLLAENHEGLAPAFIATCEFDPIRDEGNVYAEKLQAAGVPVQHKVWAGQPHLLFQLSPVLDDGKALISECVSALKDAFK